MKVSTIIRNMGTDSFMEWVVSSEYCVLSNFNRIDENVFSQKCFEVPMFDSEKYFPLTEESLAEIKTVFASMINGDFNVPTKEEAIAEVVNDEQSTEESQTEYNGYVPTEEELGYLEQNYMDAYAGSSFMNEAETVDVIAVTVEPEKETASESENDNNNIVETEEDVNADATISDAEAQDVVNKNIINKEGVTMNANKENNEYKTMKDVAKDFADDLLAKVKKTFTMFDSKTTEEAGKVRGIINKIKGVCADVADELSYLFSLGYFPRVKDIRNTMKYYEKVIRKYGAVEDYETYKAEGHKLEACVAKVREWIRKATGVMKKFVQKHIPASISRVACKIFNTAIKAVRFVGKWTLKVVNIVGSHIASVVIEIGGKLIGGLRYLYDKIKNKLVTDEDLDDEGFDDDEFAATEETNEADEIDFADADDVEPAIQ